jgi:hypothetical protein
MVDGSGDKKALYAMAERKRGGLDEGCWTRTGMSVNVKLVELKK